MINKPIFFFYILLVVASALPFNSYAQADVKMAYLSKMDCSDYFGQIATIGDSYKKNYSFINRQGEIIGSAPGMMKYANDSICVFKSDKFFLTDNQYNKISDDFENISFYPNGIIIANNGYSFDPNFKEYIFNNTGELIYQTNGKKGYSIVFSQQGSPFFVINLFNDKQILFKDEIQLLAGYHIDGRWIKSKYPIIEFSTDAKGKDKYIYIKETGAIIESGSINSYMMGLNYFYVPSKSKTAYDIHNFTYYNILGNVTDKVLLQRNSKGVSVDYEKGKYFLKDNNGTRIVNTEFDDVNPFYWQSDILAVKKNGKWGYIGVDGAIIVPIEYDYAGPCIFDAACVIKNRRSYVIDFKDQDYQKYEIENLVINKADKYITSYGIEITDGFRTLIYDINNPNDNASIGYYNIDTKKGTKLFHLIPEFKDGIAIVQFQEKNGDIYFGLLSSDGTIKCKSESLLYDIGEGVYKTNDDNFSTLLYNTEGVKVYDSNESKVRITGNFVNGVAPILIEGGIKYDGSYCYNGYAYNTFSRQLDDIVLNSGTMVNGEASEYASDYIQERINFLDYYQILGNKALRDGDYSKAIEYFNHGIRLYNISEECLFGRAIAQINIGKYDEALHSLHIVRLPGTNYAEALCYYNLNDYNMALRKCSIVKDDDPSYDDANRLRNMINKIINKEPKMSGLDKAIAILGAISNGLQLFSQSIAAVQAPQQTYTAPSSSYNSYSTNSSNRKACPSCKGTGLNSAKERAAFYSYGEETYSNSPCEICGSKDSHYHKPCPSCMGKGYVNY